MKVLALTTRNACKHVGEGKNIIKIIAALTTTLPYSDQNTNAFQ